MRLPSLAAALLLLPWLPAAAQAKWGADINAGTGPRLIEDVAPALLRIVRASATDRPAIVAKTARDLGEAGIEALKRFRNPELKPLFLALATHEAWTVRHRALHVLERYRGPDALEAALANLGHEAVRLRERAAIACIKLWDDRKMPEVVRERLAAEEDFHVQRCLEALEARIDRKLTVDRVHEEHVVTRPDGLRLTPFLEGMDKVGSVAPGYVAKAQARQGGGSASRLDAADRWVRPLLGYGDEVVRGTSLQPFANLRQNGSVYHTGHDVGACMDGAGYYAPAVGVVKLVHTGSDMGTLIVVEHPLGEKAVVNSVYMHGGDTVFVEAGDRVACGQLLGTMGVSYSIENGGHYAHLHYGLYPGPFSMAHNYGYKPVSAGLADWYDPDAFLAGWVARTAPVVADLPRLPPALHRAQALVAKGSYAEAYQEAQRVQSAAGEVGARLVAALAGAPDAAAARVERLRADGFPKEAVEHLATWARAMEGVPGAEGLRAKQEAWKADADLATELKAAKDLDAARRKAARAKTPEKRRELWQKLLDRYADTPVAARIRAELEAK